MMKVAKMQESTDLFPVDDDFIHQVIYAISEELQDRPEYVQMIRDIRQKGHHVDYRVIPGPVNDGMLLLTLQVRDGGPTVGE